MPVVLMCRQKFGLCASVLRGCPEKRQRRLDCLGMKQLRIDADEFAIIVFVPHSLFTKTHVQFRYRIVSPSWSVPTFFPRDLVDIPERQLYRIQYSLRAGFIQ